MFVFVAQRCVQPSLRTQGRATIRVPKSELDGLGACHSMYRRIIPQISENADSAKCYFIWESHCHSCSSRSVM